jgi:pheromone shutdown protein TraB
MTILAFPLSQRLSALAANHQKVVAVVGAAHVPGIRARFSKHIIWDISAEGIEWKAKSDERASRLNEAQRQVSRSEVMRM